MNHLHGRVLGATFGTQKYYGMKYKNEFPLREDRIYLNHAANAPWPKRTLAAIEQLSQKMYMGDIRYKDWMQTEKNLRHQFQRLINAPSSEDIALLKNTSEGLSVIAHGLNWQTNDNIVITDQEFPFNHIVWQSLKSQGVSLREAEISKSTLSEEPPEAIIERICDENTRLIAVSSVQYGTGLRLDLKRIGAFCRQQGILFCVDAIQSLGAFPMDVQTVQADFVAADGHKWMLGPEGVAVFYCRRELRDQLRLHQYGWHMVENHLDFNRKSWNIANSGRRFECGSLNTLGIYGLSASLSLLLEIGIEEIAKGILQNTLYLLQIINDNKKLSLVSPAICLTHPDRRSGIVTFHAPNRELEKFFRELIASGIICAVRGSGIRFSPHFYTPIQQLEKVMQQVARLSS